MHIDAYMSKPTHLYKKVATCYNMSSKCSNLFEIKTLEIKTLEKDSGELPLVPDKLRPRIPQAAGLGFRGQGLRFRSLTPILQLVSMEA